MVSRGPLIQEPVIVKNRERYDKILANRWFVIHLPQRRVAASRPAEECIDYRTASPTQATYLRDDAIIRGREIDAIARLTAPPSR
jgi:hypothetical protein